jgi:hypothetical protein
MGIYASKPEGKIDQHQTQKKNPRGAHAHGRAHCDPGSAVDHKESEAIFLYKKKVMAKSGRLEPPALQQVAQDVNHDQCNGIIFRLVVRICTTTYIPIFCNESGEP